MANINDLVLYAGNKLDDTSWLVNFSKIVDWLNDIYGKLNQIYEFYNQTIVTVEDQSPDILLQNNYKYQCSVLIQLNITYPTDDLGHITNFTSSVDFCSGSEQQTTLNIPAGTIYPWGEMPVLELNTFYRLLFEFDGQRVKCTCQPFGGPQ